MSERKTWYVGTMNDGLFIIDKKPKPAPVDDLTEGDKDLRVIATMARNDREASAHADILAASQELLDACEYTLAALTTGELVFTQPDDPKKLKNYVSKKPTFIDFSTGEDVTDAILRENLELETKARRFDQLILNARFEIDRLTRNGCDCATCRCQIRLWKSVLFYAEREIREAEVCERVAEEKP